MIVSVALGAVAIHLALNHPQYGERPVWGILVCWLRGHGEVGRSKTNFSGFFCETCKLQSVDLSAFGLIDEGYVSVKKEEKAG